MRETKFRAWLHKTGPNSNGDFMLYSTAILNDVKLWDLPVGKRTRFIPHEIKNRANCGWDEFWRNVSGFFGKVTIMQFTGLRDKNDKEIYEGDILHAKGDGKLAAINQESYFKVKWNDKNACFTFIRENYPELEEFDVVYDMATNMIFKICEVVGNIYEGVKEA